MIKDALCDEITHRLSKLDAMTVLEDDNVLELPRCTVVPFNGVNGQEDLSFKLHQQIGGDCFP